MNWNRSLFVILLLCWPALAWGQTVRTAQLKPLGYCQLTSLSGATGLSSCSGGIPAASTVIIVAAESQAVRWRDDGTNPTASVGVPIANGTGLTYQGDLTKIKFIEQAASATLDISFYTYSQ